MTALTRLVDDTLLKPNINLKALDEIGQHFNQCVLTSIAMAYRGFAFDRVQYQKLIDYILREITMAEKSAWQLAGEPFNLHNCRATRQVTNYC